MLKQQRESPAGWSEYYEKHYELQDGTDSDSGDEWTLCVETAEPHVYHLISIHPVLPEPS
jgi:hypothetical protein